MTDEESPRASHETADMTRTDTDASP